MAQLTWGVGGNGGDGVWNGTNQNWWNGSSDVQWDGGEAMFGGVPGIVTSQFPGQTATGLTFNVAGYQLQSGAINGSPSGLTITVNAAATISSALLDGSPSRTLTKKGAGVLTVTGTNFFDDVQIDAGEYRVSGSSSLFFSDVTLANAPGVVLTVVPGTSVRSLSGGGALGGVVRPDNVAGTVTLPILRSGSFGGALQDNGSGKLALDVFASGTTQTLIGVNTYTGPTNLSFGTVVFSGNGSAVNSAVSASAGSVRLDNGGNPIGNRLSDTLDLTLSGGTLDFRGHVSTPLEESLGVVRFSRAAKISVMQPGPASTQLNFAGAARLARGPAA